MPFSLVNAPATFQIYINETLQHLINIIYIIYLNNILIYFTTKKQHIKNVYTMFLQLWEYHLYVNLKKCSFFISEVEFLEFIVGTTGVKIDPSQIKSVTTWPQPTFYKNIQIFLGFANFYHWFISHYFKITVPLTGLLKGSVKSKKTESFEFPLAAKEAFNKLWKAFCSASVLKHFNPVLPIQLETNASGFALAGILSQPFRNTSRDDTSWHSIAF